MKPCGWLWRTLFSITFSTIRASSVSLPATPTRARAVRTSSCCAAICVMSRRERVGHDLVERDDRASVERAVLRAREHEEALQQRLGMVEVFAQTRVERPGLWRHAVGLGDRDVEACAHHRQWGAQLVRGVGDEPPLRVKRGLEACEQLVDRVRQLLELVARAGQREPLVQALLGDPSWSLAVIVRNGESTRPATTHPSATEIAAIAASAIPDSITSWCRSTRFW